VIEQPFYILSPLLQPSPLLNNTTIHQKYFLGKERRWAKSEKVDQEMRRGREGKRGEEEEKGSEREKRRDGRAETRACMRENWRERTGEGVRARENTCARD